MSILGSLFEKLHVSNSVATDILGCDLTKPVTVNFLNAHAVNLAIKDPAFMRALLDCDFLLRDGIGVDIGLRMNGYISGENNNGTDLIPKILASSPGVSVALIGSEDRILSRAQAAISNAYGVNVVLAMNGFDYEFSEYEAALADKSPRLVVLAMGMPKQELFSQYVASRLSTPMLILSGGAILSFIVGDEVRAPRIVRGIGMEWLWRFLMNPRRLFRRYFIGNAVFLYRVFNFYFSSRFQLRGKE